jgi:hypothetical protein
MLTADPSPPERAVRDPRSAAVAGKRDNARQKPGAGATSCINPALLCLARIITLSKPGFSAHS